MGIHDRRSTEALAEYQAMVKEQEDQKRRDRRSNDTLAAGKYAAIEVDDPSDPGETIVVLRQLRSDPLARLHSHHQIDEAQYHAGRCYQRDWEVAERGARAIDPTREAVDGGMMPEPITDKQAEARNRLIRIRVELGRVARPLVDAVLIDRKSIEVFSEIQGRTSARWYNFYGRMFREGLDLLAVEYGLAGK